MLKCTADLESFGTLEVVVSSIYSRYKTLSYIIPIPTFMFCTDCMNLIGGTHSAH